MHLSYCIDKYPLCQTDEQSSLNTVILIFYYLSYIQKFLKVLLTTLIAVNCAIGKQSMQVNIDTYGIRMLQ